MERRLSADAIVRELAESVCRRVARQAIRELQQMPDAVSGYSLRLRNLWDALCVQPQSGQCGFWALYDAAVDQVVTRHVEDLEPFERDAVRLCSAPGDDWDCGDEDEHDPYPVLEPEVVTHIVGEYLDPSGGRTPRSGSTWTAGVPDAVVAGLLGHGSTATLHRHYASLTAQARTPCEALGRIRQGSAESGAGRGSQRVGAATARPAGRRTSRSAEKSVHLDDGRIPGPAEAVQVGGHHIAPALPEFVGPPRGDFGRADVPDLHGIAMLARTVRRAVQQPAQKPPVRRQRGDLHEHPLAVVGRMALDGEARLHHEADPPGLHHAPTPPRIQIVDRHRRLPYCPLGARGRTRLPERSRRRATCPHRCSGFCDRRGIAPTPAANVRETRSSPRKGKIWSAALTRPPFRRGNH